MKVLIINSWSNTGSTGKISYGLYTYLKSHGHSVKLCCRGTREVQPADKDIIALDHVIDQNFAVLATRLTGYEGIFNKRATAKVIRIIQSFKPDVVQLFNLHAYYINQFKLLEFLKMQINLPVLYTMFDEHPYMGRCAFAMECNQYKTECVKCPHQIHYPKSWFFDRANYMFNRKKYIYNNFRNITFASVKWSCERAKQSALLKDHPIIELDNPINYDSIFFPRNKMKIREELGIPQNNKVILTVAVASIPSKGGQFFVDVARKLESYKDISFIYIGYDVHDWNLPSNLTAFGFIKDQNRMAEFYSTADLFLCTSLADLTPNACLDALGCGTPIAGFKEGGVPYCAEKGIGFFVDTFDIDALAGIVANVAIKTDSRVQEVRNYAYNRYSGTIIYPKIENIYKELINNRKKM